jgi:hypothetical protein
MIKKGERLFFLFELSTGFQKKVACPSFMLFYEKDVNLI